MTPFRKSQSRAVLEGIVRALAPQVCSLSSLQAAVRAVAEDPRLWAELDAARPLPAMTVRGVATMETSSVMQVNET